MRGNADSAEVCCHCVLTKSSMSADQSADSMPHADSIRLFLCGDVMTGTREQSGRASSQRSHLARTCIGDARTYVELAERVNGAIPSPTEFDYIWGRENPSEGTDRGESRNVANGATHQDSIGTRQREREIPGGQSFVREFLWRIVMTNRAALPSPPASAAASRPRNLPLSRLWGRPNSCVTSRHFATGAVLPNSQHQSLNIST